MRLKPVLTLDDAKKIAAAAEAEAVTNNWAVTIVVADDAGNLVWLQRMDGAALNSLSMAQAKARTSALGRRETKIYEDMINNGRYSFLSAPELEGMIEGALPIMYEGQCLGAVGVSGVRAAEDAQIARAGVAALPS
ncbi:MAG: heme-binding protein [Proteobacteria bacterium]|nr:heme-binding protein [Pseudomonadota bacterium]